jgi:hypothetical protein
MQFLSIGTASAKFSHVIVRNRFPRERQIFSSFCGCSKCYIVVMFISFCISSKCYIVVIFISFCISSKCYIVAVFSSFCCCSKYSVPAVFPFLSGAEEIRIYSDFVTKTVAKIDILLITMIADETWILRCELELKYLTYQIEMSSFPLRRKLQIQHVKLKSG